MDEFTRALMVAQTLLETAAASGEGIPRETIEAKVREVLSYDVRWKAVDPDRLVRELEARFSIWIGDSKSLEEKGDHLPWLVAERREGWRLWNRYRQFLTPKLPPASVDQLDRSTDRVLGLLEDPQRSGSWDRRGLVVGHVQSGKTSHYTGLICKAADAGYRVIIVLAGLHDNLRSQTQMRLDEGFLGRETEPGAEDKRIGVGIIDPQVVPYYLTNRTNRGDFSRAMANNFGVNPPDKPTLFVVKKNKSILSNLLTWIGRAAPPRPDGSSVIDEVPVLVIDDEADQASVDTKEQTFDGDGQPDPDYDPTQIVSFRQACVTPAPTPR